MKRILAASLLALSLAACGGGNDEAELDAAQDAPTPPADSDTATTETDAPHGRGPAARDDRLVVRAFRPRPAFCESF